MSPAPVDVARSWFRAAKALDADALAAASHDDFEWVTMHRGTRRGHEGLRAWVERQSYGVAMHTEAVGYFHRDDTVVAPTRTELRYVEDGELAGTDTGAVVIVVRGDRVASLTGHPDLPAALRAAGLTEAEGPEPA
ncbi:MAG: nuclear transport factor 2 family protein [Solirubrobacteraceae bacterium]